MAIQLTYQKIQWELTVIHKDAIVMTAPKIENFNTWKQDS